MLAVIKQSPYVFSDVDAPLKSDKNFVSNIFKNEYDIYDYIAEKLKKMKMFYRQEYAIRIWLVISL